MFLLTICTYMCYCDSKVVIHGSTTKKKQWRNGYIFMTTKKRCEKNKLKISRMFTVTPIFRRRYLRIYLGFI